MKELLQKYLVLGCLLVAGAAVMAFVGFGLGRLFTQQPSQEMLGVGSTAQTGADIEATAATFTRATITTLTTTGATFTNGTLTNVTSTYGDITNLVGSTGTFSVSVTSPNLPNTVSTTLANATNTTFAVQNTTGRTLVLLDAGFVYASTVSVGSFAIAVGTSTTAFTSATPTSPLLSTVLTTRADAQVITTTSSLMTAHATWRPNEWLVGRVTTTTNQGTFRALYY
jgi:hypothetical protein